MIDGGAAGEVLACLLLLPVALLMDFFYGFKRARTTGTPRENELAIASHGAGFLALAALAVWIAGPAAFVRFMLNAPRAFPGDWMHWLAALAFAAAVVCGFLWFLSGARRSVAWAGFRDSRLMTRALVKIALGGGVWMLFWHPSPGWPPDVVVWLTVARMVPASRACILAVVAWLLVTGSTKFLLVMWPRFGSAREEVADDIAAQDFDWDEV